MEVKHIQITVYDCIIRYCIILLILISELYDVKIEYCGVGSSDSKFNICFKNKDTEIESNVRGSLDTSSSNKFHLTCVVDGTMYRSNIAFIENSVHLFNKVLSTLILK